MKLIFIDIDGVLVTENGLKPSDRYFGPPFNADCAQRLVEAIAATGAQLVVTSSWREGRTLAQLQYIFEVNGMRGAVIGLTPSINDGASREREIMAYLAGRNDVDRFVIIDDEEKMTELAPYLVETDFQTGITERTRDEAIRLLGAKRS